MLALRSDIWNLGTRMMVTLIYVGQVNPESQQS